VEENISYSEYKSARFEADCGNWLCLEVTVTNVTRTRTFDCSPFTKPFFYINFTTSAVKKEACAVNYNRAETVTSNQNSLF
jgi:hypothetical protein